MLAPIYCNSFELQTLNVDGHALAIVKFYYQDVPIPTNNPFPRLPFAPVAFVILERRVLKDFLNQMRGFLAQQEEHHANDR